MIRFLRNVKLVGWADALFWKSIQQEERLITVEEVMRLLQAVRNVMGHFMTQPAEGHLLPKAAAVHERLAGILRRLERLEQARLQALSTEHHRHDVRRARFLESIAPPPSPKPVRRRLPFARRHEKGPRSKPSP